jgi:HAD superfamily hydrolase (TIGR01509 family)
MNSGIKVIITDLDGVIRHFPIERDQAIELRFNLPEGILARLAFEPALLEKVITGQISDHGWRIEIQKNLSLELPNSKAAAAVLEWSNYHGYIDHQVINYLKSLSSSASLVLLTNATSRLNADLDSGGIRDKFKVIFNSSELGMIKPDPRLFQHVCDFLGVLPAEALFIDDSRTNVRAAAAVGFKSIHFTNFTALQRAIEGLF